MSAAALRGRLWTDIPRLTGIGLAVVFTLVPVFWMVTMAFKPYPEWTPAPGAVTWLPRHPTLSNFAFLFGLGDSGLLISLEKTAWGPILASTYASVAGTAIAVSSGTMAAYAFSRFGSGANLPLSLVQLRLFPPATVIIPIMFMWTYLHFVDTAFGLSLIYGIVTMPFSFWLMKTFFDDLPREVEEAALIEGCGRFRVFWKVSLPLMRGPLASTALFTFIMCWSDYFIALLLTKKDWVTIPVFMANLSSSMTGEMYGAKAALGLIAAVPPVLFGIAIQRHLVRGLTFGATKQ